MNAPTTCAVILKQALDGSQVTHAELASKLGVSRQAVDGWVSGTINLRVERLGEALKALGWSSEAIGGAVLRVLGLLEAA